MQNKELGFDKDQIVVIPISKDLSDTYKTNILSYPDIINVTGCDRNFSNGNSSRLFHTHSGKPVQVNIIRVEEAYVTTLGIDLIKGRNFSESFPVDQLSSVIVNETLVKEFDLQAPIGTILKGYMFDEQKPNIVGVVKDYHVHSLREKIPPLILHMTEEINGPWSVMVKIRAENIGRALEILKEQWHKTVPNRDFNYTFLNDDLNLKYKNEERWQKITGISTLFSFIISSMGLLGLVIIIINARTKEIGIRKVLGASIASVIAVLGKDIAKWVIIANLIAWPIAWYVMNRWLENFVYKTEIAWWYFLLAGAIALIIAIFTVSVQTLKAALANPINALRYE
jgi:putative ABC transport system permease protein